MQYLDAKTIVTKTKNSFWFGTQYTMNIYRGCCHGCIYCDSRSECYRVDNFDKIAIKKDALKIIRNDLDKKHKKGLIGTGSMSDPYNPFEKKFKLTRHSLELVNAYRFGITIATKSPLVTRDIDIIQDIKKHSPALVKLTITTTSDDLSRKIEPHVMASSKRFAALNMLAQKGIYAGILFMPALPFINANRENIIDMVKKGSDNGAKFIYAYFGLTMRDKQRDYFYSQLDRFFPNLREKYQKNYGIRYSCNAPNCQKLYSIFYNECEKHKILYKMPDIISNFKRPYDYQQFSLLGEALI